MLYVQSVCSLVACPFLTVLWPLEWALPGGNGKGFFRFLSPSSGNAVRIFIFTHGLYVNRHYAFLDVDYVHRTRLFCSTGKHKVLFIEYQSLAP